MLGDPTFCENRMVVLQDPEVPPDELATDVLTQAIGMHLPLDEERVVSFKESEVRLSVQEEETLYMDLGTGASAYSGEAGRELASPCFTPQEEHLMEQYARVASPDIAARFLKPIRRASDMLEMNMDEVTMYINNFRAETESIERAQQEYREHWVKVKVWLRAREEERRHREEERAEQARVWEEDRQRRVREGERRQREENEAEEMRRKKGEKRQLEEKTRIEVERQLEDED